MRQTLSTEDKNMNALNTIHFCGIEDRENKFYCVDFVMIDGSVKVVSWYDTKGNQELIEL